MDIVQAGSAFILSAKRTLDLQAQLKGNKNATIGNWHIDRPHQ